MLHSAINLAEAAALEVARALLAGEAPDDRADSKADWLKAAQEAVDGDTADLEYYLERAASYDAFEDWAERHDRAGNYSFDDWFHGDYPGSNRDNARTWLACLDSARRDALEREWAK